MASLLTRPSSIRPIRSSTSRTTLLQCRSIIISRSINPHQVRTFRFRWTSHWDPDTDHRDHWRRHRTIWQKYMLCTQNDDAMSSLWSHLSTRDMIEALRTKGRYADAERVERMLNKGEELMKEARKTAGIYMVVDTTRNPEDIVESKKRAEAQTEPAKQKGKNSGASKREPVNSKTTETKTETFIDPITNKRVVKNVSLGDMSRSTGPSAVPPNPGPPSEGQTPQRRGMTGDFVRDFPEEFTGSWSQHYKPEENPENANRDESSSPLEPALDRAASTKAPRTEKPSPKKEVLKDEDLVKEIRDIYEDSYGKIEEEPVLSSSLHPSPKPKKHEPETPANPITPSQSSLYKILAVDPVTQTIQTAEASSIVADSAVPLTVAEVMQRLANPSKFFPYFGHLQAQGYEVVSGSGDVLVFRKVREATQPGSNFMRGTRNPAASNPASKLESNVNAQGSRPVNPIDMMGSRPVVPNIQNFSPTGYVNYDTPRDGEHKTKPPPPFRSGIDVRREEEVFSGRKLAEDGRRPFGRPPPWATAFAIIFAAMVATRLCNGRPNCSRSKRRERNESGGAENEDLLQPPSHQDSAYAVATGYDEKRKEPLPSYDLADDTAEMSIAKFKAEAEEARKAKERKSRSSGWFWKG